MKSTGGWLLIPKGLVHPVQELFKSPQHPLSGKCEGSSLLCSNFNVTQCRCKKQEATEARPWFSMSFVGKVKISSAQPLQVAALSARLFRRNINMNAPKTSVPILLRQQLAHNETHKCYLLLI